MELKAVVAFVALSVINMLFLFLVRDFGFAVGMIEETRWSEVEANNDRTVFQYLPGQYTAAVRIWFESGWWLRFGIGKTGWHTF